MLERRAALAALGATVLATPSLAAQPGFDLAIAMARMAAVPERREAFREERELAALGVPLVLTGTLGYRRPGHLEKRTEAPQPELLVVDGEQVQLTPGNEPTQHLDLGRAPELRALVDAVRAPLAGDLVALRRSFSVEAAGTPERWTLELRPLDPRAARILREVRLRIHGTNVAETLWLQANGDRYRMLTRPIA